MYNTPYGKKCDTCDFFITSRVEKIVRIVHRGTKSHDVSFEEQD